MIQSELSIYDMGEKAKRLRGVTNRIGTKAKKWQEEYYVKKYRSSTLVTKNRKARYFLNGLKVKGVGLQRPGCSYI